jgi:hypothetical protein
MPWNSWPYPIGSWTLLLDRAHRHREVRARLVHLVDEAEPRHAVALRLAPDRFRLRLDTLARVEDADRAVEHAHRTLHLGGEVDVTGRVDDRDRVVLPLDVDRRRGNGDAALPLLLEIVHGGRAVMDLADLVDSAGDFEDALGDRGLAGVDMGHDAHVPVVAHGVGTLLGPHGGGGRCR